MLKNKIKWEKNERGFFRDKIIEWNEMVRINNKMNLFESG